MGRLENPLELALARSPDRAEIPIELIRIQPSPGAAFSLSCQASGLEDKEIYLQIGIDAGTFSRIKKGEATLQADKEAAFCRAVGNAIYPEWRAYQLGCTLVVIKSEAERRAEEAELRAKRAEDKVEMLKSMTISSGTTACRSICVFMGQATTLLRQMLATLRNMAFSALIRMVSSICSIGGTGK